MGVYSAGLAGESKYQWAIGALRVGQRVLLVPEPENPFDGEAVKCTSEGGHTLGYVPRGSWLQRCVNEGQAVSARVLEISGGTQDKPTRGVVLEVRTGPHAESD